LRKVTERLEAVDGAKAEADPARIAARATNFMVKLIYIDGGVWRLVESNTTKSKAKLVDGIQQCRTYAARSLQFNLSLPFAKNKK